MPTKTTTKNRVIDSDKYHDLNNILAILLLSSDQLARLSSDFLETGTVPSAEKLKDISAKIERSSKRIHTHFKELK